MEFITADFWLLRQVGQKLGNRTIVTREHVECARQIATIQNVEVHVPRVASDGPPAIGVAHAVDQCPIPAARTTEYGSVGGYFAHAIARLDGTDHVVQDESLPPAKGRRVDVLIAAEGGEGVGHGEHDRSHAPGRHEPVEALRQAFTEGLPREVLEAAARETGEIDKQRKIGGGLRVAFRQIHGDLPRARVAQSIVAQGSRVDL